MLDVDIPGSLNDNATPCGVHGSLTNALSPGGTPVLGGRYRPCPLSKFWLLSHIV